MGCLLSKRTRKRVCSCTLYSSNQHPKKHRTMLEKATHKLEKKIFERIYGIGFVKVDGDNDTENGGFTEEQLHHNYFDEPWTWQFVLFPWVAIIMAIKTMRDYRYTFHRLEMQRFDRQFAKSYSKSFLPFLIGFWLAFWTFRMLYRSQLDTTSNVVFMFALFILASLVGMFSGYLVYNFVVASYFIPILRPLFAWGCLLICTIFIVVKGQIGSGWIDFPGRHVIEGYLLPFINGVGEDGSSSVYK